MARLRLSSLLGAGPRAVSRYTGTLFAVFLAQGLVAAMCMLAVAFVLVQQFSHVVMFDEAVDGDLVALVYCLRFGRPSWLAIGGIVFGAVVTWQLASWFLVGGLNGVLAQRPEGRGDTARCFGASGATTYLSYAVLAVFSLLGLLIVAVVLGIGISLFADRIRYALTLTELLGPLVVGSLPGLVLLHFLWTVTDYARAELTLRYDTHNPGVLATYVRTIAYVIRRPVTLVHGGFGWLLFGLVTAAYAYLAHGHPMYGAEGAVTLFVARQGVALLRMAIRFGILAGQIELGRTRALPPRRTSATIDPKS